MAKKIFKVEVRLNSTSFSMKLIDIKGVKPFAMRLGVFRGTETYAPSEITFRVSNGGRAGKGISMFGSGPLDIMVFNGKSIISRNQRTTMRRGDSRSPSYDRTRMLVLRNALEKYFYNVNIDFDFKIIDNTTITRVSDIIMSYQTPGLLQLEALETSTPLTKRNKFKVFRKNNPGACLVHDKNMCLVLLHKVTNKKVLEFIYNLRTAEGVPTWVLPYIDEDGSTCAVKSDLTYVITKNKKSKHKAKKYVVDIVVNKWVGTFTKNSSNYNRWGNGTTIWQPTFRQAKERYGFEPCYGSFDNINAIVLPPMPSSLRNTKLPRMKGNHPLAEHHEIKKHTSLSEAITIIRNLDNRFTPVKRTRGYGTEVVNYTSNIDLGGVLLDTKELCVTTKSKGHITVHNYSSPTNNKFKVKGYFVLTESTRRKIKNTRSYTSFDVLKDGFFIDLNATEQKVTEDEFCVNLGETEQAYFSGEFTTDDYTKIMEQYADLWDDIIYKVGGELLIEVTELDNLELPPTKRCTPFDFMFQAGVEYETGVSYVSTQSNGCTGPMAMKGVVYGTAQDGGGIELKTVVMQDPTVFKYIGKFDALCKSIRKNGFKPKQCASNHIHMSIVPSPKVKIPKGKKTQEVNPTWYGEALFRRTLIGNNWMALFNKYFLALSFLDGFNPGGRRFSNYGMGLRLKNNYKDGKKKLHLNDSRYTVLKGKQFKEMNNQTGRDSLLRTNIDSRHKKDSIHWEWRGTDACPSALFMGLKIEFMQAMAREAINRALKGEQVDIWDQRVMAEIEDLANVKSVFEITDKVCRNKAKVAIKELKPWMTTYAYKGLMAWATYVNILDERAGTVAWFIEMEKILVTKIGPKLFVTAEDLEKLFKMNTGYNCFTPDTSKKVKGMDKAKIENYSTVITANQLNNSAQGHSNSGYASVTTSTCHSCGKPTGYSGMRIYNIGVCPACLVEEDKLERWKIPEAKEYTPPKNQTKATKELINSIVTKSLIAKES